MRVPNRGAPACRQGRFRFFLRACPYFLLLLSWSAPAAAAEYTIVPEQSEIHASIRYTLIGWYAAHFEKYDARLNFDPDNLAASSVKMVFYTGSIASHWPRLDKIVRSPRLLNAPKYPQITFQSRSIEKQEDGSYTVEGMLSLHGIAHAYRFSFDLKQLDRDNLYAEGRWKINRKDFNIIWSQLLDHGGIIVSDIITIDWSILAQRKDFSLSN